MTLVASYRHGRPAADIVRPFLRELLGDPPPLAVRFWDGSSIDGPPDHPPAATIVVRSPQALSHLMWAPGELGLARAYVSGDLDLDGDVFALLDIRDRYAERDEEWSPRFGPEALVELVRSARSLGVLGRRPSPPAEEVRLQGRVHTRRRDARAVSSHYDASNDFYRLLLGPSWTYSCGYWPDQDTTLEQAQAAKYELISAKLGLSPGQRLLDVGCGWGGMALHAATHHGVDVVGVTLSREQHRQAVQRVAAAGLEDRVEIRLQDYRDIRDGPFDAISSIGMFEHVGAARMAEYFTDLHRLLADEGRLVNHAISRPRPTRKPAISPRSFMGRYVFPDSELLEVGTVVSAMQAVGLEVRDVESLREHYGRTLRSWLANLEHRWDDAQRLVGPARARVWRLYLAGSALGFEHNRLAIHQVLGVRASPTGTSGIPATRTWLDAAARGRHSG